MYGTIMHGRLAPGASREAFMATISEGEAEAVPGFVSSHLLTPDAGGDDLWLVVFFDDRASYRANADDPAQHDRYMAFRAYLADDPEWIDGEWATYGPGA